VVDHPVEQYCRDAKIFSIYEGTNHIQAVDLVARKIQANGGESFAAFMGEIERFVREYERQPGIGGEVRALGEALEALKRSAGALMDYFMAGKIDQVTLYANAFLETMAEVTIAHLLLEAAVIAESKRSAIEDDQSEEDDFYEGKVAAAKFFVNFILPGVQSKMTLITNADRSALDVPNRGFSSAG
jgi:F0F1-type ATP synthase gamma subunit